MTDYIPVTYEIEERGEVLGWSPAQVMEPYDTESCDSFMKYMEDNWGFR